VLVSLVDDFDALPEPTVLVLDDSAFVTARWSGPSPAV
jgi:hypothetical protein